MSIYGHPVGGHGNDVNNYAITLLASNWSSSTPYTQTVAVTGIKSSDNSIADINMSSATTDNSTSLLDAWGLVGRISINDNSITAYCYEDKPTIDIPVNIITIK